jgi:hypothetical protein
MDTADYLIDHSRFDWKNMLGEWEWLFEDEMEVAPWLMNRFGDLFFTDEQGAVNWLNINDGELTEVAASEEEFIELLEVDENVSELFLMALVDELAESHRKLGPGQCFAFRTLPVLGGEYDVANIHIVAVSDYWRYCGKVFAQLDGLPDGTELEIDIPDVESAV